MMNAIIMAAGTASRFVPLSEETPKGLLEVRGEIMIERQIRQLQKAGVRDITIVLGYKAEKFEYLKERFKVNLVYNEDYNHYNNSSSVVRVLDKLSDTFLCCSDHYYVKNVFLDKEPDCYYAVQYAEGPTSEWCTKTNAEGRIIDVAIGGEKSWYMAGHVRLSKFFSEKFKEIFSNEYQKEETRQGYWEDVLIRHLRELPIYARKYSQDDFREFDSIDELRAFDPSYFEDTRSTILKKICLELNLKEKELSHFERIKHEGDYILFCFQALNHKFVFDGSNSSIKKLLNE